MTIKCPFSRATGRAGSVADHSLHEPGYSVLPGRPACAIASRLWQAVTPEPHWCTTWSAGAWPRPRTRRAARRRLEAAVGAQVVLEEAVRGAGDVAGDRVQRLDLAAEAFAGAGVEHAHAAQRGQQRGRRRWWAWPAGGGRVGRPRRRLRAGRAQRAAGGQPGAQAAVEHGHRIVAQPAQQPPGACGIRAALAS
jgi:hypothetical protein